MDKKLPIQQIILSDSITRIRNAQKAMHMFVVVQSSNLVKSSLAVLKKEDYIKDYAEFQERKGVNFVKVDLKYHNGSAVIQEIKMVSKPGCRYYTTINKLHRHYGGLGNSVISTPIGVLSDKEARANKVGGEVLFKIL